MNLRTQTDIIFRKFRKFHLGIYKKISILSYKYTKKCELENLAFMVEKSSVLGYELFRMASSQRLIIEKGGSKLIRFFDYPIVKL